MCLSNISLLVPHILEPSNRFTHTIEPFSSTALYVLANDPLPNNSAFALINCSILYTCVSPALNTKFPLFLIAIPFCTFFTFSSSSFVSCILITSAAASAASASSIISLVVDTMFPLFLFFFDDDLVDRSKHITEQSSRTTPLEKPRINANRLWLLESEL
ncbi:hypothetical protein HanRHA438_Chr09g0416431 [Helianthus annuus]|nr:hypothetical protein HanRHA438_Chr09g0416431 [Helianthus annuus]